MMEGKYAIDTKWR